MSTYFQWISVPIADFLGTEFLSQSPGVYCLLTHGTKFLTQRLQQFTLALNQWETTPYPHPSRILLLRILFSYTPISMAKVRNADHSSCWGAWGPQELPLTAGGDATWNSYLEDSLAVP